MQNEDLGNCWDFLGPGPEPTPSWRLRRSGAKIKGRRGSGLDGCTFAGQERENKKGFFSVDMRSTAAATLPG